jgi:hypothetical protein
MRVHHHVCCGIDVHKKSVTACLMWGPADREPQFEIRRFGRGPGILGRTRRDNVGKDLWTSRGR